MRMMPFRKQGDEMPFLDHLEELRWRLIWSVGVALIGAIIGFLIVKEFDVLGVLVRPIEPFLLGSKLKYLSPTDPFFITVKLGILTGLILVSPIIIYQVWAFLSPALLPSEKRAILPALYFGLVLFSAGVAMAYFVVLPLTLQFTMSFQEASLEQSIVANNYLTVVVWLLLAFGFVFELPVVLVALTTLGVVSPEFLAEKRRHAIAGITILSSAITPGDVMSSIFMMIPLIGLYEVGLALSRALMRKRLQTAALES